MAELAEKILLLLVSLPLGIKLVDLLLPVVALLQQLVVLLQQLGDLLLLLGGQQPQAAALPWSFARCCCRCGEFLQQHHQLVQQGCSG